MDKHSENLTLLDQKSKRMMEKSKKIQTASYSVYRTPDETKDTEVSISQMGYKDLFDNMPKGCACYQVTFDEESTPVDLKYVKINAAYKKNVGYPQIELIGKSVTEIFSHLNEVDLQWMKKYIKVALSGEPTSFTQYFAHQDKWYSIYAYSPQYGFVVEISEDITERKEHEAKVTHYVSELAERNMDLNTSQSHYRDLLDHMHNIFQYHRVIDDGNGQAVDLEFAEVNPAFEMWTGLKIADVVGKRLPLVAHGIDKAYWIQVLGDVALTRQPILLEKYLENIDTWYKVSAYSPKKGYVASILEDITERKKAEMKKDVAQKQAALIESVASLGALAAGVAHEINQPLQALKIMSDSMIYWYDKGKDTNVEKMIENCRHISEQAGYITAIVEWMQDSANRAWSDTPEEVDVSKVITQAVKMVQERIRMHSIQLREITCMNDSKVWGDIRRLEEIVIIILTNAIDSLNDVDQTIKEIVITTSCVGEKAVIEISNNGPAIPDGIIGKMFEPFFSSSRSENKLGMGLAIVKSIVNAHNGTIQASNLNQLVTFRIELPLYRQ